MPLSQKLLGELRAYWLISRPKPSLFPGTDPRRPITRGTIAKVCRKAARKAVQHALCEHGYLEVRRGRVSTPVWGLEADIIP